MGCQQLVQDRVSPVHRYYDPATEQFLSVDPLANVTGTSYAFAADDPVNAFDPNGLDCGIFSFACSAYDATAGGVKTAAAATGHAVNEALPDIHKYLKTFVKYRADSVTA